MLECHFTYKGFAISLSPMIPRAAVWPARSPGVDLEISQDFNYS